MASAIGRAWCAVSAAVFAATMAACGTSGAVATSTDTDATSCEACEAVHCNDSFSACKASADCRALAACEEACNPADLTKCQSACEAANPGGVATFGTLAACVRDHCAVECKF